MKRVVVAALILVMLLFLAPLILWGGASTLSQEKSEPETLTAIPSPAATPSPSPTAYLDLERTILVKMGDKVETMTMDKYLWGVVAAEMPASFEPEALKAQAVAARTYSLWRMGHTVANHPEAQVCTDSTCCQAYISPENAAANWGENAGTYTRKITDAVSGTDGMVILYDNSPIDAVFHSSSAGQTEDAVEVWGNAVPYLVGVDSPEGDEVPNYHTSVRVSQKEALKLLKGAYPDMMFGSDAEGWFSGLDPERVRTIFSLRSAHYTVEEDGEELVFTVTGYGHGVGMSQYGANALARSGKTYLEIVKWYYTGVTVERYSS